MVEGQVPLATYTYKINRDALGRQEILNLPYWVSCTLEIDVNSHACSQYSSLPQL